MGDMMRAWLGKSSVSGPVQPEPMLRVSITCEACGRRHTMERPRSRGEEVWVVCHECEMPLHAEVK